MILLMLLFSPNQSTIFEYEFGIKIRFSKVILISSTEAIAAIHSRDGEDRVYFLKLNDNKILGEIIYQGIDKGKTWPAPRLETNLNKNIFGYLSPKGRFLLIEKKSNYFKIKTNTILKKPPHALAFEPTKNFIIFGYSEFLEKTNNYLNELTTLSTPDLLINEEKKTFQKNGFEDFGFFSDYFVIFYDGKITVHETGKKWQLEELDKNQISNFSFNGPLPGKLYRSIVGRRDYFGLPSQGILGYYFSYVDFKKTRVLSQTTIVKVKDADSSFHSLLYADKDLHLERRSKKQSNFEFYVIAKNSGEILDTIEPKLNRKCEGGLSLVSKLDRDFVFILESSSPNPSKLIWIKNSKIP